MSNHSQFYSVIRAQWQHIGFSDVHKIRSDKANENHASQRKETKENIKVNAVKRELAEQD